MSGPVEQQLLSGARAPRVLLADARAVGIDEPALRAWARDRAAGAAAAYSSRSYRYPYALVAWHDEPVGVDIERIEPFDEDFLESICTPSERSLRLDPAEHDARVAALWCSKEALTKALGDAVRYDPRRVGSPIFWADGRSGPWRAAPLSAPSGHTAWLCWRSPA